MIPMYGFERDPFVDFLLQHRFARTAVVVTTVLFLAGAPIGRFCSRLPEATGLRREVRAALPKILKCLRSLLLGLLACAGSIAVIVLMGIAEQAAGPRWEGTINVFGLVAVTVGGLTIESTKSEAMRAWATVLFAIGMIICAMHFLSITMIVG